jgi:hypothetical protein
MYKKKIKFKTQNIYTLNKCIKLTKICLQYYYYFLFKVAFNRAICSSLEAINFS